MDDFTTQPGVPNALFGLIRRRRTRLRRGTAAELDDADDFVARWEVELCDRIAGGTSDYFCHAVERDQLDAAGMEAQAAINAPRFHHQWLPDQIFVEENFPESTQKFGGRGLLLNGAGILGW